MADIDTQAEIENTETYNKETRSPYTPEELKADPDKWADWMLNYENPRSQTGHKFTPEDTLKWIEGIANSTEKTIAVAKRIEGMTPEQIEAHVKKSVEATNEVRRHMGDPLDSSEKYLSLIPEHPKQIEAQQKSQQPAAKPEVINIPAAAPLKKAA